MLMSDVKVAAESDMLDITSAYIKTVTEMLIEAEEFDDFTECYFETVGRRNRKIQIDGYYYDEVDRSCIILICDFVDDLELGSLNSTQIDTLYDRMRNFVLAASDGYIRENCEESSMGYEFAREIGQKFDLITKFRFYIISNQQLKIKAKSLKKDPIEGKPVDLNVWDISRIFDIAVSKMGKESIEINFEDFKSSGIASVLAVKSEIENYESYLCVIPGNVLADIYIEYGARLLEGNVRAFLSIKGKVNKEIRNTILNEPAMFFAYNNGIAATATAIETNSTGTIITKIKDLQIINGGQTTASIANVVLQDKKDVSDVFVPMKLSIIDSQKAEEIIPRISKCANSQNKIDEADFFSNHPYHICMENLSRKTFAPAVNGNQYQTIWFYERARGQHTQEQMKLSKAQREKYLLKNPKNQIIKKVDLAKYMVTYWRKPHEVSRGAQKNMHYFAKAIDAHWKKSTNNFNPNYYKNVVALAIIFHKTEKLISDQDWYKETKSYRANIVTYTLAIIFETITNKYKDYRLDLKRIWNSQDIYADLYDQLVVLTREVYLFITRKDRLNENVTEWCKKDICWERACAATWTMNEKFLSTLVPKIQEQEEQDAAKKEQKLDNEISLEMEVINLGSTYWKTISAWAEPKHLLSPMEHDILKLVCEFEETGKLPTARQAKILMTMREKLYFEGMPKK